MKECPYCRIKVGGNETYCPLCQKPLTGQGEDAYFPATAPKIHRVSMLFKVICFLVLSGVIISLGVDYLILEGDHLHFSVLVLLWSLAGLFFVRILLGRRYNGPLLAFQLLVVVMVLSVFTDVYLGFTGISVDLVVPVLCSVTLLLNFLYAFINSRFTANALVYLLMNIVIGVLPYLLLLLRIDHFGWPDGSATAWVVCLLISVITFLCLVIFKGRTLWTEIEKRLHM